MRQPFLIKPKAPISLAHKLQYAIWLQLGKIMPGHTACHQAYREHRAIQKKYQDWLQHSPEDGLSPTEIKTIFNDPFETYIDDINGRRDLFETRPPEHTFQGVILPLIREVIHHDPQVQSILEIGAYYGYINHILAKEFPHMHVYGIDFPDCMSAINQEFTQPNLKFLSGYALDQLESGELTADIVYFVSTATRLKNKEYKRYLNAIKRYIVLNEPLIELPGGGLIDPADLPTHRSTPVVYHPSSDHYPPCFIHNYKAIAEEQGFKVLHYRVYTPPFTQNHLRIEMVAVKQ